MLLERSVYILTLSSDFREIGMPSDRSWRPSSVGIGSSLTLSGNTKLQYLKSRSFKSSELFPELNKMEETPPSNDGE